MTNQQVSDVDILATLERAEESGIPALLTSQFSDVGNIDLSNERLNKRLELLEKEGRVGHQKASGRHMWWITSESEGGFIDAANLDPIDYDEIDIDKLLEERKKEVEMELNRDNFWERLYGTGEIFVRASAFLIGLPVAMVVGRSVGVPGSDIVEYIPNPILGLLLIVGTVFVFAGTLAIGLGFGFSKLENRNLVTSEPLDDGYIAPYYSMLIDLCSYARSKLPSPIKRLKNYIGAVFT